MSATSVLAVGAGRVTRFVGSGLVVAGTVACGVRSGPDSDDRARDVDHVG